MGRRLAAHRPPARRAAGRADLRRRPRRGRRRAGQRVPDQRDRGDARRVPSRAARRSARSPATPARRCGRSTSASAGRPATSASSRRSTAERFDEIVDVAVRRGRRLDGDLLVLGEMGIGNTTAAAAVAAALAGGEAAAWVGRGTGVDDAGLAAKRAAVQQAVRRIAGVTDPIEVLREVGGSELIAIAAAVVAARHRRCRWCSTATWSPPRSLPLVLVAPDALDHCIVGHCSSEAGPPAPARAARQAAAARPRHAPRRGHAGRWRPCRSWRWPAPASPRSRRSPSGSVRPERLTDRWTGSSPRVQFLTRMPVRTPRAPPTWRRRCVWFPVVGGLIGAAVGGVAAGLRRARPDWPSPRPSPCCSGCRHRRVPRGRARRHGRRPRRRVDPRAAAGDPRGPAPRQLRRRRAVRLDRPARRRRGRARRRRRRSPGWWRRTPSGAVPAVVPMGVAPLGQARRARRRLRPLASPLAGPPPAGLVAVGIAALATGWWAGPLAAAAAAGRRRRRVPRLAARSAGSPATCSARSSRSPSARPRRRHGHSPPTTASGG